MGTMTELRRCARCLGGGVVTEPSSVTAVAVTAKAADYLSEGALGVCLPCVSLRERDILTAYQGWFMRHNTRHDFYTEIMSVLMRGMV